MPATTSGRTAAGGPIPTSGRSGRLATTTTLLLAAAFLAGCTITIGGSDTSDTVDQARIADAIRRQLHVPADLQLGSVACPKGVKLAEGVTFTCTADVDSAQLPLTVTLSHVDTDTGEFDYNFKLAKALIDTDDLVKEIESKLPVQTSVGCGPRLQVVEVEEAIECTISEGSNRQVVRAVVDDVDGMVHFEPPLPGREVVTGRLGDKLTVYDDSGDAQLELTVTRVKFSTGDGEPPQRGLYMGAYVKAHALADVQYVSDIYALVRGHLYEQAITGSLAFDPRFEAVTLNKGQRAAGWIVFDVPARHGRLEVRDLDDQTVGGWKY
jgi:hypothetical protein